MERKRKEKTDVLVSHEETETVRSETRREHETLGPSQQQEVSRGLRPSAGRRYKPVPDPTAGHLEAITGIIYNRSEVTRQKCRCRDSGGAGARERESRRAGEGERRPRVGLSSHVSVCQNRSESPNHQTSLAGGEIS